MTLVEIVKQTGQVPAQMVTDNGVKMMLVTSTGWGFHMASILSYDKEGNIDEVLVSGIGVTEKEATNHLKKTILNYESKRF